MVTEARGYLELAFLMNDESSPCVYQSVSGKLVVNDLSCVISVNGMRKSGSFGGAIDGTRIRWKGGAKRVHKINKL